MRHDAFRRRHVPLTVVTVAAMLLIGIVVCGAPPTSAAARRAEALRSIRLYVFDCGTSVPPGTTLKVATTKVALPCFLVAHPKGTLMWDVGAVPDAAWKPTGAPVEQQIVLPNSQVRNASVVKPLNTQLAEAGYSPSDITYLALSHYHWDHTANANDFARATWLVRQVERDAMFAQNPTASTQPSSYAALRNSKTVIIRDDEYDVFGDGTAIIKFAPGHTPGHQVLYLKLIQTGPIVLSGDLYHYPEERSLRQVPAGPNQEQERASRAMIDASLMTWGARLWIQHDFTGDAKLTKAPKYYE